MIRSASIFLAFCLVAQASCEYFSFGYPDVGNQASELVYTTGYADRMDATSTWVMRLYRNPPGYEGGIVYKKTPVTTAHNGFTTKFTYAPTICQSSFPSYAGGYGIADPNFLTNHNCNSFAFFLTSSNISATPKIGGFLDSFGLNAMSDVIMAGYTVTSNDFMICNWTNAPETTHLYEMCPRNHNLDPPYNCSKVNNATHFNFYTFTVVYDTKNLTIYVDDELKFSLPIQLDPIPYTIGFAANIGVLTNSVFRQDITRWNFTSLDGPAIESFKYDGLISSAEKTKEQFTTIGSAQIQNNSLQIVPSSQYKTGAILLHGGVPAYRGFHTRFNWAASECNTDNGDGFAFFVSQAPPNHGVLSSFGNGLGIINHRNSLVLAFSAYYDEFRYCDWGKPPTDWGSCQFANNTRDPVQCDDHLIEIYFDGSRLKMYFDEDLVLYENAGLGKGLYFVGISGANGMNYFRQDITAWSYETLDFENGFDYPVLGRNPQFDTFGNARWGPSSVTLTDLSQNQTGVVVYSTPLEAHNGFELTFDWISTINQANNNSATQGITIFFSKTYPTARQVSESGKNNRGVLTLPNTYAIVIPISNKLTTNYRSYFEVFGLCKWKTPYSNVASMAAKCYNDTSTLTFAQRTVVTFTLRYDGKTIEVHAQNGLALRTQLTMDWSDYYIGIAATSNGGFAQEIQSFTYKSNGNTNQRQFSTFNAGDVNLYSDAIIDYQLRLTNPVVNSIGAVILPNKVDAYFGFQTSFTYHSSDCRTASNPPAINPRPTGFAFFLSENLPSASAVASSTYRKLGIGNVPNVGLVVAYDNTIDYFYVCQWDSPLVTFYDQCRRYSKLRGTVNSCDKQYVYSIIYDGFTLQLWEEATLLVSYPFSLPLTTYYAGLSSSNPPDQIGSVWIDNWEYNSNSFGSLSNQLDFEFTGNEDLVLYGEAFIADEKLVLTNDSSQTGAAFYPHMVRPSLGFNSSFLFLPTNCDPEYNGADGFTLFFSKQLPDQDSIIASGGGMLGIQQLPNVTMLAYSATNNEFYVADWKTPTTDLLRWFGQNIPNPQPKPSCSGVYQFNVVYDDNLSIYINGGLVVSTNMNFDPVGYYVGLSGATGGGYWTQQFGNWQFDTIDL